MNFSKVPFIEVVINGCLISETSVPSHQLLKTLSSPRPTASKQTMQNIVMATVEVALETTECKFADLSGNQLHLISRAIFVEIHIIPWGRLAVSLSLQLYSLAVHPAYTDFKFLLLNNNNFSSAPIFHKSHRDVTLHGHCNSF